MSEAFRVDPQALADAVQQMAEFTRHAESMITEIDSLISNLHAAWSGEAAAAHAEAHRHWAAGEEMMRAALSRLRAAGETAHTNYTGAMSTNLAMWS
ncbi:WXG100 family type VII secretion target [Mycobacterium szulgai]|uniref:Secretion protein n=1 Tax=Mycobacterium szulgai TaxID=1787 RepID=A0A1X2F2Y9_MYCSZ|nr:WXG100 family type VII secretion target [Mycobacterium szulgai]MCV7075590.1 WXG100 family type VII secretion target [Mycobacterium szulgai]ORX12810.1 secretion protein [Mycobacterium szulgai]